MEWNSPSFDFCVVGVTFVLLSLEQRVLDSNDLLLLLHHPGDSSVVSWLSGSNSHQAKLSIQGSSVSVKSYRRKCRIFLFLSDELPGTMGAVGREAM